MGCQCRAKALGALSCRSANGEKPMPPCRRITFRSSGFRWNLGCACSHACCSFPSPSTGCNEREQSRLTRSDSVWTCAALQKPRLAACVVSRLPSHAFPVVLRSASLPDRLLLTAESCISTCLLACFAKAVPVLVILARCELVVVHTFQTLAI